MSLTVGWEDGRSRLSCKPKDLLRHPHSKLRQPVKNAHRKIFLNLWMRGLGSRYPLIGEGCFAGCSFLR